MKLFCPTDQKFATGSDDATARVWDFARCTEERVLRGHGADVRSVDWHPIKGLLATGSRDSQQPVKLWDPRTGNCLATLYDHKNSVMSVQWNKNGNWLLSGSRDHMIKLYDVRMMKEVQTFRGHRKEVTALSWHPVHEGLFVSGGGDGSLGYWMVNTEKELALLEQAHDQAIWTLEWHPLGHILSTGSNDNNTKFWARNRPGDTQEDIFGLTALTSIPTGVLTSTAPYTAAGASTETVNKEEETEESKAPMIPGMGLGENIIEEINRDISTIPALGGRVIGDELEEISNEKDNKKPMFKQPPPKKAQRQFERMWVVSRPMASDGGEEDGSRYNEQIEMDGYRQMGPPRQFRPQKQSLLGPRPSHLSGGPPLPGGMPLPRMPAPPPQMMQQPLITAQNTSWRHPPNNSSMGCGDSWINGNGGMEAQYTEEDDVDMRMIGADEAMDDDMDYRGGGGPPPFNDQQARMHGPPLGPLPPLFRGNFPPGNGQPNAGGFFQAPPMPSNHMWGPGPPPPRGPRMFFNQRGRGDRGANGRGSSRGSRSRGRGRDQHQ